MPAVAVHFPDLATPGPVGPALLLPDPPDVQPGPAAPKSNKFDPLESVKSGVAEPAAAPALTWPTLLSALGAAGGYAGFGLAAVAFGGHDFHSGDLHFAAFVAPLPIALASTQVSLAVGHQWLGLSGRPEDLPRAAAQAWASAGRLALGLVPLLTWFATTGDPAIFRTLCTFLSLAVGGGALFGAGGRLRDALLSRRVETVRGIEEALGDLAAIRLQFALMSIDGADPSAKPAEALTALRARLQAARELRG